MCRFLRLLVFDGDMARPAHSSGLGLIEVWSFASSDRGVDHYEARGKVRF